MSVNQGFDSLRMKPSKEKFGLSEFLTGATFNLWVAFFLKEGRMNLILGGGNLYVCGNRYGVCWQESSFQTATRENQWLPRTGTNWMACGTDCFSLILKLFETFLMKLPEQWDSFNGSSESLKSMQPVKLSSRWQFLVSNGGLPFQKAKTVIIYKSWL